MSTMSLPIIFIIVTSATSSVTEWIPIASTPLHRVPVNSTKLITISDQSDEFICRNIHNLTMLGYGKAENPEPEEDFLNKIHNKLIRQIEDRMTHLGPTRRGKTYHIGFPSLEGALVSISLLLFAVYLIKLVMKVVYTFNAKRGTTEYIGFLSNLRQPILLSPNRQKREIDLQFDAYKITNIINDQSIKYGV